MSSLELVLAISLLLFAGIAVDRSAALAELEAEQNAGFATPREFQMTDNYFRHHDEKLLHKLFDTHMESFSDDGILRSKSGLGPAHLSPAPYAEWAHYHWVWLSNDRASQEAMTDYAKEYLAHNISVGAIDIDSEWETGFNNFKFNSKYPNVTAMVEWCHNMNISVIFWMTSMVDTDSDNYKYGADHEYYIKDILGKPGEMKWWHGKGSLLDYSNSDARDWWHKQMDNVLATGIDGWKCDGTDPYILELVDARGKKGHVSYRDYANDYYGDTLDYTRSVRGQHALIMSRPVDSFGPLYLRFSPPRVMFSGWVGDADGSFKGLTDTLKRYLQSAWSGYANFGSDIGGYRSGNSTLGRTKEVLIRWAQLGAFSPLMENGGSKEHRPWMFDQPPTTPSIESIYREYVNIHYQLVPYLLTTGSLAYESNKSSLLPLAPHQDFIDKLIDEFNPPTFNYLLGEDILVAPIVSDPAIVNVTFPEVRGNDTFVAWWNTSLVYHAGTMAGFGNISLETFTVFHRTGSLFPLRPAPHPQMEFTNHVSRNWLQFQLFFPLASIPDPVQVIDEGSGLIAAYWRTNSSQHGRALHLVTTAHSQLKVSVHVFFDVSDDLNPCHASLVSCFYDTSSAFEFGRTCRGTSTSKPLVAIDTGRVSPRRVGEFDPGWYEMGEGTARAECDPNGQGHVVIKHGTIAHGLALTIGGH